jgi:hypothetical protein
VGDGLGTEEKKAAPKILYIIFQTDKQPFFKQQTDPEIEGTSSTAAC